MPRHLLALALGVCAGVAVMVVAARGIALSRMLYLLASLIFAGNLFAALAFDYWSMLAARFIAGLPHSAYFGVGAIVAISLAAPGQASRDVCLMVTGMTIANLVGVPLGSFLAWSLSWRATFAVSRGAPPSPSWPVRRSSSFWRSGSGCPMCPPYPTRASGPSSAFSDT